MRPPAGLCYDSASVSGALPEFRRVGRVAEGAPLLRAYRLTPIEGSNPSLSATNQGDLL